MKCKYYKQKKQYSEDNGQSWYDVIPYEYRKGELYEYDSPDCEETIEYLAKLTLNTGEIINIEDDGDHFLTSTMTSAYKSNTVSAEILTACTEVGYAAFRDCSGLTSVTIPDSVNFIWGWAFSYCTSLTSVTLPDSVAIIMNYAFSDCSGLTSVIIGNSVTSIEWGAFQNCKSLTSVTIGNSVTNIGAYAFEGCSGLTSVIIPDSVTSIGSDAFGSCSGLTSVTIGNSVTSIGQQAFLGCYCLTSVTIPSSVTSIEDYAFRYCTGLTSITVEATTPPTLGNYALDSTNNCPIYVPSASVNAYKTADGWSTYASRILAIT